MKLSFIPFQCPETYRAIFISIIPVSWSHYGVDLEERNKSNLTSTIFNVVLGPEQWSSTWSTRIAEGTRRHLRGVPENIIPGMLNGEKIFRDKHGIIRARFRVSHRRPGRKDIRFGSAIFLSLPIYFRYNITRNCFVTSN
jgi:hypothetical protein